MREYDYDEFRARVNALTKHARIPRRDKPVGVRDEAEEDLLRYLFTRRVDELRFGRGWLERVGKREFVCRETPKENLKQ